MGGLWSGVVDPGGAVTAIFTYPSLGFVSEVLGGQIDPNGSVSFSGPRDVGQGRFENFLAAGRWSARDGSQVGTWHGSMAPTGQPAPRTGGISGAYVGRYQSTSGVTEAGVLGVVIYPDLSFLAVAISTLDPQRKDVGVGLVGPDGVPVGALTWAGSTVTGGSLLRGGTYDAGDHAGTFDLAPGHRRPPALGAVH
ncbi:MAG: hypothetical protein R3F62_06510 [Planctomycetota bacterium]